jgi:hypothetical protein
MYIGLHVEYLLFLADFYVYLEFYRQVFENHSNFMKICPVRSELFHGNRRTCMTKLLVAFRKTLRSILMLFHIYA